MCTITNDSTGLVVEVFAHNQAEGARTVIWPDYGGSSEHFRAVKAGSFCHPVGICADEFHLVADHSGMCVTDDGRNGVAGRPTVMRSCEHLKVSNGGGSLEIFERQIWFLREIPMTQWDCPGGGCFSIPRFVLVNSSTQLCLDAGNAAFPTPPPQGAELATWPCIDRWSAPNAVNQNWRMTALDAGPGSWVRSTLLGLG